MRQTACVLVGNQKGGVGKSTLAVNGGVALAELGLRVLLWDLDPAAGATSHLGLPLDLVGSLDVLTGGRSPLSCVLSHERERELPPGLDLLPSSRALEQLRSVLEQRPYTKPWECLRNPLAEVRGAERYDLVLLDTPPNLSIPTRAALIEADWFLAALTPTQASAEGLAKALEDVQQVRVRLDLNPGLQLLGGVLGQVDGRQVLGRTYPELYREQLAAAGFAGALFETQIEKSAALERAWHAHRPLAAYDPREPKLEAWRQLARELLARLGRPIPRRVDPAAHAPQPLPPQT